VLRVLATPDLPHAWEQHPCCPAAVHYLALLLRAVRQVGLGALPLAAGLHLQWLILPSLTLHMWGAHALLVGAWAVEPIVAEVESLRDTALLSIRYNLYVVPRLINLAAALVPCLIAAALADGEEGVRTTLI